MISGKNVKRGNGFTLLEILIALGVLASMVLTISQLMSDSSRRMRVTANSFFAIQLAGKVMADLSEEVKSSPAFLEFLAAFPEMAGPDPVVDAQSVYFRYLSDRKPPFGEIRPEIDGGIKSDDGQMYQQFKPFKIGVDAARLAPPDSQGYEKHLARLAIKVSWAERDGQERSYVLTSMVPSPVGPRPRESLNFDEKVLVTRGISHLYPAQAGQPSERVRAETGADIELLRRSARVTALTHDLCRLLRSFAIKLQKLAARRAGLLKNPNPALGEVQLAIAQNCELGASVIFLVHHDLLADIEALSNEFRPEFLPGAKLSNLSRALQVHKSLPSEMKAWLRETDAAFGWLLSNHAQLQLSQRSLTFCRAKVCEAKRLRYALGDLPIEQYLAFIKDQRTEMAGRNPFLERFFIREEALNGKPEEFRQVYSSLEEVRKEILELTPQTAEKTASILAKLPPPSSTGQPGPTAIVSTGVPAPSSGAPGQTNSGTPGSGYGNGEPPHPIDSPAVETTSNQGDSSTGMAGGCGESGENRPHPPDSEGGKPSDSSEGSYGSGYSDGNPKESYSIQPPKPEASGEYQNMGY